MATLMSRRAVVPAMLLGTLGAGALLRTASARDGEIASTDIGDGLVMFTGAGGNVVAHEGPDSVALIDGGSPERSAALLAAVDERFGGKPVALLVNTHWHLAQTGSNDALGRRGVPIVAHEYTKRWMTTRIEQGWEGPVYEPRAEAALPSRTFFIESEFEHGGQTVPLVYTPRAHTDGDIHAVFRDQNVIAAGGIAYPADAYPILDTATGGWIGEMLDATRTLLSEADEATVIVPADGRLVTREDLVAQEAMLDSFLTKFQQGAREGKGADDMLAEGMFDDYRDTRGDPTAFILTAWDGLWDHMSGLRAF